MMERKNSHPGRLGNLGLPAVSFAASAIALGHALQISSGFYDAGALAWVVVAFGLCLLGTATHRTSRSLSRTGVLLTIVVLVAGILWQIAQLLSANPGAYLRPQLSLRPFHLGVVIEGLLLLIGVSRVAFARRAWFPILLAVHTLLGVWMLRASPNPNIDVVVVTRAASYALLHGNNPYGIGFPNIYGTHATLYYNAAFVVRDWIDLGYPYPAASLLLALPGYVLFHDYRYAQLALLIAAAALIGYSWRNLAAQLAAALLLTTPRGFFVLELGWTEPTVIFALALSTFLLRGGPLRSAWSQGLMLATKQYMPFVGLASLRTVLLDGPRAVRIVAIIVATGAIVTLPLALWNPNAFMRSVVWVQMLDEPFRRDSLSVLSWAVRQGLGRGSFLWAVGAASLAAVMGVATTRNNPSGFAACAALTIFAMFVFGSKAFCNYYYFVIGAVCCSLGAFGVSLDQDCDWPKGS